MRSFNYSATDLATPTKQKGFVLNYIHVVERQEKLTLQHLYMEVARLISLAYPGPTNNVTKIVARDLFLDACENPRKGASRY